MCSIKDVLYEDFMKTVSFTEFRKNASNLFSDVKNGEKFLIMRHGRAVAEINPALSESKKPSWKKQGVGLSIKGAELFSAIIEERERENLIRNRSMLPDKQVFKQSLFNQAIRVCRPTRQSRAADAHIGDTTL